MEGRQVDLEQQAVAVAAAADASVCTSAPLHVDMLAKLDEVLAELPHRRGHDETSEPGAKFSVFATVGVDGYAVINEAFGKEPAEMLVRRVAEALQHLPTKLDSYSRIGVTEYGVLLEERWQTETDARAAGLRFALELNAAVQSMLLLDNGIEIRVVTSCGIVVIGPPCTMESGEIVTSADIARKLAVRADRSPRIRVYEPQMQHEIQDRVALISGLRKGLSRGELELYAQPVVNRDREVVSCEALIRWNNPKRGLVTPDQFIPVVEQTGMIIDIGNWVIREASKTLAAWSSIDEMHNLHMSVNVSARQLEDEAFSDSVLSTVAEFQVRPERLLLEVTEGMLHRDAECAIGVLERLADGGVCTSLDDFGTGYSSLSCLQQLPVKQLKIDKSFVHALGKRDSDLEVVRMIVQLAKALKIEVVAEGVETEEQFAMLAALDVERYQGWLFGKAVPLSEFSVEL